MLTNDKIHYVKKIKSVKSKKYMNKACIIELLVII